VVQQLQVEAAADGVIRTVGLTKVYPGGVTAVDGLELTVAEGEIFGLLGPNGAGKTTTASMLTTRVIPTAGEAYVGGIDVVRHPAVAKQLIGVVPQTNTLDRALTVWENLYFHGRFFGMGAARSREVADELLVTFHLKERANAPVMALSGGMAQRLMVARALVHNPAILFLDEPTAGLDPQSRIGLWEIVGGLHNAGQTVVLTTHNMEEADQLCDRIGIMDHGRILALGTAAELKASVGADTMVTVSADGDLEALAGRLRDDVEGAEWATTLDGSVQVAVRGGDRVLLRVIGAADDAGYTVRDVQVAPPSLENVFIKLTGKEFRD
jgi:ABC-2 type transport system ATP-binding protein